MADTRKDSPPPAASITPEGKAANEAANLTPDPLLRDNGSSGYGVEDGTRHPGDRSHEGGDPRGDGDAQYGASPLRSARYEDDHDAEAGIRRHRGVQPGKSR